MYPLAAVRSFFLQSVVVAIVLASVRPSSAQSLLPIKPGMAVATCAAAGVYGPVTDPDFVVGIIDVRNPPPALIGKNWMAPMYHGPNDSWTSKNLGQIFGICIDVQGNIYVTATTAFGSVFSFPTILTGPGGPGGVYKLDGQTGAISIFAQLPNTGPALGNICYDRDHDQFFVTDFEDGRIYRLAQSGAILSTFDPKNPDDRRGGFAPLGERPWGIGVYEGRVYYGIWGESDPALANSNEVRSVGLDKNGEFLNDDRRECAAPPIQQPGSGSDLTSPVSDIAFSQGGMMLLAERSMMDDTSPGAHQSRVLLYEGGPGNWTFRRNLHVGNFTRVLQSNSAGGVDFAYGGYDPATNSSINCDEAVWATGDALRFPGSNPDGVQDYVYGITRIPTSGNTPANVATTSYYIDLDANTAESNKTLLGDVEVFRLACQSPGSILTDSVTICSGDTVALSLPRGNSYRWNPAEYLSCDSCRNVLAFPQETTTYTADVTDASGTVTTHRHTVITTDRRTYILQIGTIDSSKLNRAIVPVDISSPSLPDLSLVESFTVTIEYPKTTLFLETTTPALLEEGMIGTIAEGWKVNILESRPGRMRVEFTSPTPGQGLRDSGTLFRLAFTTVLADYSQRSPVSVTLALSGLDCIAITNAIDTVTAHICGADSRLIEFTFPKYSLEVVPGTITEEAQIDLAIPFDAETRVEVFDLLGNRVAMPAHEIMSAGEHRIDWKPGDLPSGTYYLRASSGEWSQLRQIRIH